MNWALAPCPRRAPVVAFARNGVAMRYRAYCPACQRQSTIQVDLSSDASSPTCLICGTPLRLSTETMQNTPLADAWLVPRGARETATPVSEYLPGGLSPERQAAFEALLRHAELKETELAGYAEL